MNTVLFDHNIFTIQAYGGVSRYFYSLFDYINKIEKWNAVILAGLHMNKYLRENSSKSIVGWYFPRIPKMSNQIRRVFNDRFSKNYASKYPPSIFHETWLTSSDIIPKYSPYIITVHDMIHERLVSQGQVHDALKKEIILKKKAINRAHTLDG